MVVFEPLYAERLTLASFELDRREDEFVFWADRSSHGSDATENYDMEQDLSGSDISLASGEASP